MLRCSANVRQVVRHRNGSGGGEADLDQLASGFSIVRTASL
jgi:hypothetical protein